MASSQTTEPQGPSLESASQAIQGLLSGKPEDKQPATATPEQAPPAEEPTLEPAAPAEESAGSESAHAEEPKQDDELETPQPKLYPVKVDGVEHMVTEEELLKSYSFNAHNTRKAQALAEERKRFEEQEVAAVRAERQQYATYLGELKAALEAQHPKEPDWQALRASVSPDVFAAEVLNWQQTQKQLETIKAEQAKTKAQQERDAAEGFRQHVAAEQAKMEAALPEMKDPEKARALKTDLSTYAMSLGFTADDLAQVTDHRLVLLLHHAMQHDKAQKAAPKIENKIAKAMGSPAPGARTTTPPRDALKEAKQRLKQSGSLDDGAAAINALLSK